MSYSALRQDPRGSPRELQLSPKKDQERVEDPPAAEESAADLLDVVQFSSGIYIVNVDEGHIQADIMRIGKMEGQLSFNYKTAGASAIAGKQFEMVEGSITMEAGQDSATIEVPILSCGRWNPTTEFCVTLSAPVGCTLGMYLKCARVKVLDGDAFPLNRFADKIAEGDEGVHSINKFALFGGFVYQMWRQDGVQWRTVASILLDQLHNGYIYLRLCLSIYMVDKVFNMKDSHEDDLLIPGNREGTAICCAALIVFPMFVLYVADVLKTKMDIAGILQRDLSRNLFRKFMNYDKQSREEVPTPDMVVSLTTDVGDCTQGYMKCLRILQLAGKLAIAIYFTLQQNPSAWWACVLIPSLMAGWGKLRTDVYITASEEKGEIEGGVCAFVNEALNKINLIADYQQRPQMNEIFAEKSEGLRMAQVPETMVVKNNMFFPKLLGPALVALYTAVGGAIVLQGGMKLGIYLATISVFGDICDAFTDFFEQVMQIIGTFAPLVGLTIILNKSTDVPAWKVVNRKRRELTKEYRGELLASQKQDSARSVDPQAPFVPATDKLEIKLADVSFAHPASPALFSKLEFNCKQGCICACLGEPGRGRRTLMEMIAHKMFPTDGSLFIPSHLRILYVSTDAVLLNMSLWKNLTFGNSKGNDPFRVESILKALNMTESLEWVHQDLTARKREVRSKQSAGAQKVEEEEEEDEPEEKEQKGANPLARLRDSQKAKIHLARALIMNPEVMVLHRPFQHFPQAGEDDSATHFRGVMKDHVECNGYMMSFATKNLRRPRTIFFTPDHHDEASIADVCWILPHVPGGPCHQDTPENVFPQLAAQKGIIPSAYRMPPLKLDSTAVPQLAPPPAPAFVHPLSGLPLAGPDKLRKEQAHQEMAAAKGHGSSSPLPALTDVNQEEVQAALATFNGEIRAASPEQSAGVSAVQQVEASMPQRPIHPSQVERKEMPSTSTMLRQELLALGPRPMGSLGAEWSPQDPGGPGNFIRKTAPTAPKPLDGPNKDSYGSQLQNDRILEPSQEKYIEGKTAEPAFNRRCCGP